MLAYKVVAYLVNAPKVKRVNYAEGIRVPILDIMSWKDTLTPENLC